MSPAFASWSYWFMVGTWCGMFAAHVSLIFIIRRMQRAYNLLASTNDQYVNVTKCLAMGHVLPEPRVPGHFTCSRCRRWAVMAIVPGSIEIEDDGRMPVGESAAMELVLIKGSGPANGPHEIKARLH